MSTEDAQDPVAALRELRACLEAGLAAAGLSKTTLAGRVGLGRTTVSSAFSHSAPAPSAHTVVAIARGLGLEARDLLDLRAIAAGIAASPSTAGATTGGSRGVGRPIAEWDPHDLEVHPAAEPPHHSAGTATTTMQPRAAVRLPRYVFRPHDAALARLVGAAAKGSSQLAVLVGSSSTGKTRACWEAVQALAELGWRLWHPFDPTRADAVLADLARVTPHTVVWLNEAQHYVGAEQGVGERIAAALHDLLTDRARGPVLVLGTLWPEYVTTYTACPAPWQPDPHSRTRELLAGRLIHLPDRFDTAATHAAQSLADDGDQQLAHALAHARNGCLTQFLAGAPELLHRYATASPAACAVLHAAMDARRLGVGLHLPMAFLEHAAQDYLSDEDYHALGENWLEQALADLGQPVHGNLAPLRRVRHRPARRTPGTQATEQPSPPAYLLADYLEQHGHRRRRMLCPPTSFWEAAYHHLTRPGDLNRLARAADTRLRTYWAHHLWHKAAGTGNTHALIELARMRDEAGDRGGAERLLEQAADADDTYALIKLARMREEAGDRGGAERLLEQAADAGDVSALTELARMREETGDQDKAEQLLRQAADANDTYALAELARIQEEAGKRDGAEPRAHEATTNSAYALAELARMRDEAGDRGGAERLLEQAADAGDVSALTELARMREETGDRDEAEQLAHKAATTGSAYALAELARMRRESGDRDGAERLLEQAADAGSVSALAELARMRRESGDRDGAERLLRQAADAATGYNYDLVKFVWMWGLWPHGLNPDGTPSAPW